MIGETFIATFAESEKSFSCAFAELGAQVNTPFVEIHKITEYIESERYDGEYIVTPKASDQTIPTKDKVLIDDITIKAIPYVESDNSAGGKTVTIG